MWLRGGTVARHSVLRSWIQLQQEYSRRDELAHQSNPAPRSGRRMYFRGFDPAVGYLPNAELATRYPFDVTADGMPVTAFACASTAFPCVFHCRSVPVTPAFLVCFTAFQRPLGTISMSWTGGVEPAGGALEAESDSS